MAFPFARIDFTYAKLLTQFLVAKKTQKNSKKQNKTKQKQKKNKNKKKQNKKQNKNIQGHVSIRNIQV